MPPSSCAAPRVQITPNRAVEPAGNGLRPPGRRLRRQLHQYPAAVGRRRAAFLRLARVLAGRLCRRRHRKRGGRVRDARAVPRRFDRSRPGAALPAAIFPGELLAAGHLRPVLAGRATSSWSSLPGSRRRADERHASCAVRGRADADPAGSGASALGRGLGHHACARSPTPITPCCRKRWRNGRSTCSRRSSPGSWKSSTKSTAASSTTFAAATPATRRACSASASSRRQPTRRVRMAHLAVVGSHSTNGVAAIHSDLLRTRVLRDFAELFPERFNNKTNGVTPRRWLQQANPSLSRLITDDDRRWLGHRPVAAAQAAAAGGGCGLSRAIPRCQARGQGGLCRLAQGRPAGRSWIPTRSSTVRSSAFTSTSASCSMSCTSSFSTTACATTRTAEMTPHTFFFAGKAAPAYHFAKLIIKLINHVAGTHQRGSGRPRPPQGAVPARIQRQPGRAAHSRERRVRADFDGRLRSERHRQHEVHDERRADHRHPRRRHHRDGRRKPARRTSSCSA